MFASIRIRKIAFMQPLILLLTFIIPVLQDEDSVFGLGLFVSGVILLYKGGYLEKHRALKISLLIAYLYGIELWATISKSGFVPYAFSAVFFITAFLAFLYLMFKDQVVVYLQADKPKLSLSAKGLSKAEIAYVRSFGAGKSQKEIGTEAGVVESTVRNTLARAYKKLGVADKSGLMRLLSSHDLVD